MSQAGAQYSAELRANVSITGIEKAVSDIGTLNTAWKTLVETAHVKATFNFDVASAKSAATEIKNVSTAYTQANAAARAAASGHNAAATSAKVSEAAHKGLGAALKEMGHEANTVINGVHELSGKVVEGVKGVGEGFLKVGEGALSAGEHVARLGEGLMSVGEHVAHVSGLGEAFTLVKEGAVGAAEGVLHLGEHIAELSFEKVTEGAKEAFSFIIEADAKLELTNAALTNLFAASSKSMDEAKAKAAAFGTQIMTTAKGLPFHFAAVQESAQKMLAEGFDSQKILPNIQAIGNALAALGKTSDTDLQGVVNVFDKIQTSGHLTLGEINQLDMRGIPALQMLADHYGKTTEQIRGMLKKGAIDSQTAIAILGDSMAKKYKGAAAAAMDTWTGLKNNIEDDLMILANTAGKPIFEALKGGLRDVEGSLSKINQSGALNNLGKVIGSDITKGIAWIAQTGLPDLAKAFRIVNADAKVFMEGLSGRSVSESKFTELQRGLFEIGHTASQVVSGLKVFFDVFKTGTAAFNKSQYQLIPKIFYDLGQGVAIARDSIKTFVMAFDGRWQDSTKIVTITRVFGDIGKTAHVAWDGVKTFAEAVQGKWTDSSNILPLHRALGDLGLAFRNLGVDAKKGTLAAAQGLANFANNPDLGNAQSGVRDLSQILGDLGRGDTNSALKDTGKAFNDLGGAVDKAWGKIKPLIPDIKTLVETLNPLKITLDVISGLLSGGLTGGLDALSTDITKITNAGTDLLGKIGTQFGLTGLNDILPGLKKNLDDIGEGVNGGLKAIGDIAKDPNVQALPGKLLDMAAALAKNLGPAIEGLKEPASILAGIVGSIADFVKSNPVPVLQAVGAAFVAWKVSGLVQTAIGIGKVAIETGIATGKLILMVAVKVVDFFLSASDDAASAAKNIKLSGDAAETAAKQYLALDAAKAANGGGTPGVPGTPGGGLLPSGNGGGIGTPGGVLDRVPAVAPVAAAAEGSTLGIVAGMVAPIAAAAAIGAWGTALQQQGIKDFDKAARDLAQTWADSQHRMVTDTDLAQAKIALSMANQATQGAGVAGTEIETNKQLQQIRTDTGQHAIDDLKKINDAQANAAYSGKTMADGMTGSYQQVKVGTDGTKEALTSVAAIAVATGNQIGKSAQDGADGFRSVDWKSTGSTAGANLVTGFQGSSTVIVSTAQGAAEQTRTAFSGVDWPGTGAAASGGVAAGLSSGTGVMVTQAQGAALQVQSAFKGGGWSDIGVDMDAGIAAGIRAGQNLVASAAVSAVEGAVGSTKAHMQIYSPSKRTHKEIGMPMGQGIATGITAALKSVTPDVLKSITDMANALKSSVEAMNLASAFKGITTPQVGRVTAGMISVAQSMASAFGKVGTKDLTNGATFGEALNKEVGPLKTAVEGLTAAASFGGISVDKIANLINPLILLSQKMKDGARIIGDGGVLGAGWAESLSKMVAPLKSAVDGLTAIVGFKGVTEPQIANLTNPLILLSEKMRDSAAIVTAEGGAAGAQYGDDLNKMVAPLKTAEEVLTGLGDVPLVSNDQIGNLTNPLILLAQRMKDSAKITGDLLDAAAYGDAVGKIVAPLNTAITVLTALPTVPDVSNDMVSKITVPILALVKAVAASAATIGTEGVTAAGALGDAIGKVVGGINSALSLFTTLGNAQGTPGTAATFASGHSAAYHGKHIGRTQTSPGTPGQSFEDVLKQAVARIPELVDAVKSTVTTFNTAMQAMVSDLGGGNSKKGEKVLAAATAYADDVSKVTTAIGNIAKVYQDFAAQNAIKNLDAGIAIVTGKDGVIDKLVAAEASIAAKLAGAVGISANSAGTALQFLNNTASMLSSINGAASMLSTPTISAPRLTLLPGGQGNAPTGGGSRGPVVSVTVSPAPFPGYSLIKTDDLKRLLDAVSPNAISQSIGSRTLTAQAFNGTGQFNGVLAS